MSVTGIVELQRKLDKIESNLQPKLVAQSLRASMVPMMKQARTNAPKGTEAHRTYKGRLVAPGFLQRNIKLRKMKFRDKSRVGYSLAARGEAWYGRLVETGFTHKGGSRVDGKSWLGKSEKALGSSVDTSFRRELIKRIDKAAR